MVSGLLESVVNKYETNNKVMEALLTQWKQNYLTRLEKKKAQ
jgi:hypothetical protein